MSTFDVIFIDDEVSLTEIFQHYVLAHYKGWRFTAFSNSALAYKEIAIGHLSATVWIIDLMMPGKNGVQIAEAIRAFYGQRPTLIAYTALDRGDLQRHDEYRSGLHHFNRIINKMEDPVSLLSLVDVWVQREKVAPASTNSKAIAAD
jgi:DNA-binding response OmpR family regulator